MFHIRSDRVFACTSAFGIYIFLFTLLSTYNRGTPDTHYDINATFYYHGDRMGLDGRLLHAHHLWDQSVLQRKNMAESLGDTKHRVYGINPLSKVRL